MKNIQILLLLLIATAGSAQSKFLQKLKMQNGDSMALNMTEVRYAVRLTDGTATLFYGNPTFPYSTQSSFTSIVAASCGNLVQFTQYIGSQTQVVAINPKWVARAIAVPGVARTNLFMHGSGDLRVVSGTYQTVSGLLSNCGGGSGGGADNWGSQFVRTDATLSGQGTLASLLKIAQQGATSGEVLKWNGTTWAPATDEDTGGLSDGDYGDITVTGGGTTWNIDANTITSTEIVNSSVTLADMQNIATGKVLGRTTAGTGVIELLDPGAGISFTGGQIVNTGDTNPADDGTVTSVALTAPAAVFDVAGSPITTTGTFAITFDNQAINTVFAGPGSGGAGQPTFRALVAADIPALTSANISDFTEASQDATNSLLIAGVQLTGTYNDVANTYTLDWDGAVVDATLAGNGITGTPLKIAQQGATSNQVLKWNGSTWAPANDDSGSGSVSSVGLAAPTSVFDVSGSPVTSSGTLTLAFDNQSANTAFMGPASGGAATPAFRALVVADIPALTSANISDFTEAAQDASAAMITGGDQITVTYTDISNNFDIDWDGAVVTARLTGTGLTGAGLDIAQQGATSGQVLEWNGTSWAPANDDNSGGTVTSVALTAPSAVFDVAGSPITTSGTFAITFDNQSANLVFAGPNTGAAAQPAFRSLVVADIPALTSAIISDFVEASQDATGSLISGGDQITATYNDVGNSLTIDWDGAAVDITLTGDGLPGSPLEIAQQGAVSGEVLKWTGTAWEPKPDENAGGTVTSVALTAPTAVFDIAGSPITTSGTLALTFDDQTVNTVFAGPASGGSATPTFRALVAADIAGISTNIYTANGTLVSDRTLTGGSFSLTYTGLTTHSETGSGNNTTTTTGTADIVNVAADDFNVTTGGDLNVAAGTDVILEAVGGQVTIESSGVMSLIANSDVGITSTTGPVLIESSAGVFTATAESNASVISNNGDVIATAISGKVLINASTDVQFTIGTVAGAGKGVVVDLSTTPDGLENITSYCNPANNLQLAEIGCVKDLISDSLATKVTLYAGNGTLLSDRTVTGGGRFLVYTGLAAHSESGSGNNTTTTTGTGDIVENAAGDILSSAAATFTATSVGAATLESTGGSIAILSDDITSILSESDIAITSNQGHIGISWAGVGSNAVITDASGTTQGLQYAADYIAGYTNRTLPDWENTKKAIGDSIPDGLQNQTLRYDGTPKLVSNYEITNNGTNVAIGGNLLMSGYELAVTGAIKGTSKAMFGTSVTPTDSGGSFVQSDSLAGYSENFFENKNAGSSAGLDLVLKNRGSTLDTRLHWQSDFGETGVMWSAGLDKSDNHKFKFSGNLGSRDITDNTVYTIDTDFESYALMGIGVTSPLATLHLKAGGTGALTAPLKINVGPPMTTPEDGAIEYVDTGIDNLAFTVGSSRYILHKGLTEAFSIDFASTNAGLQSFTDVTFTGAATGDRVIVAEPGASHIDGVRYFGTVTAANTVRVGLYNFSAGTVNPGSLSYNITVIH